MEAQLNFTKVLEARGLRLWIVWAMSPFPVPVSPQMRTVDKVGATAWTRSSTSRSAALFPAISSKLMLLLGPIDIEMKNKFWGMGCKIKPIFSKCQERLGGECELPITFHLILVKWSLFECDTRNTRASPNVLPQRRAARAGSRHFDFHSFFRSRWLVTRYSRLLHTEVMRT